MNDRSSFGIVSLALGKRDGVPRYIVDIGASEGQYTSNSLGLIECGWSALLIEPNPIQFAALVALHDGNCNVECWNVAVGDYDGRGSLYNHSNDGDGHQTCNHGGSLYAYVASLTQWDVEVISAATLADRIDMREVGVLSLDTEGYDLRILRNLFTTVGRPHIIVTEEYHNRPSDQVEKHSLILKHGYELLVDTGEDKAYGIKS